MRFDTPGRPVLGHLDCAFSLPFSATSRRCARGILRLTCRSRSKEVETAADIGERPSVSRHATRTR